MGSGGRIQAMSGEMGISDLFSLGREIHDIRMHPAFVYDAISLALYAVPPLANFD
jgi:hypothetical protein